MATEETKESSPVTVIHISPDSQKAPSSRDDRDLKASNEGFSALDDLRVDETEVMRV